MSWSDRLDAAATTALLGCTTLVVAFIVSFGQDVSCTTEHACTTAECAPACAWPERSAIGLLAIVLVSGLAAAADAAALFATCPRARTIARACIATTGLATVMVALLWNLYPPGPYS